MDKKDTITLVRSLLVSKNGFYELSELLRDFKSEAGFYLPLFGYKTPLEFFRSIPDEVEINVACQKIFLKPVNTGKTAHIASLIKRQKSPRVNESKKVKNMDKLNIVSCSSWSKKMNKNKSYRFQPKGSTINHKFHEARKHTNETYVDNETVSAESNKDKLEDVNVKSMENNFKSTLSHENVSFSKEFTNLPKNIFPCDIVTHPHHITKLNLQAYAEIGKYIEVCVTEVCNPYKFWLQLRKFKIKLNNLMLHLQSFYNQYNDKYKIPNLFLKSNDLCVALYETNFECSEWHRAKILKYISHYKVKVLLIDYGTVAEIETYDLRFLHCQFVELPAQAFHGHLANIRPCIGQTWPKESSERFLQLVFEKDLIAGVVDVNYEVLWLSVALSITEDSELHISDTLVEEKLAVFDEDTSSNNVKSSNQLYKSNNDVFSNLDSMTWLVPNDVGKCRKSRCQMETPVFHSSAILSYTEKNERLRQMFDELTFCT